MQARRLRNLSSIRQTELRSQYPWLKTVVWNEENRFGIPRGVAITVFDHWLTRDEANRLLENVPREEQQIRNACHAAFCALLVAETPVLSFTFRRRAHDRTTFREFISPEALSNYCTPNGGQTLRHRHFQVVLPELDCAFWKAGMTRITSISTIPRALNPFVNGPRDVACIYLSIANQSLEPTQVGRPSLAAQLHH